MRVLNKIDRFHLTELVLKHVNTTNKETAINYCQNMLEKHRTFIKENGIDMPEVRDWQWERNDVV